MVTDDRFADFAIFVQKLRALASVILLAPCLQTNRGMFLKNMKTFRLSSLLGLLALGLLAGFTGCSSTSTSAVTWTLTGTVWMVAELEGEMVGAEKIPSLQLETAGTRVNAFGGINRLAGTYKLDGTALSIGPLVSTRMAGPEKQMKIEAQFQKILASVTNHRQNGRWLILLAGEKVVARAQATPAVNFPNP